MLNRRKIKTLALAIAAALLLAAACGGLYYGMRWWRDREIEKRIDRYNDIIARQAESRHLPSALVRSVIRAESGGDPAAVSNRNAKGLMQVSESAEQDVARVSHQPLGDPMDPEYNIRVGTGYLRMMLNHFDGDIYLALAAYHLGPGKVKALREANPGRGGRDLIEQCGPRITRDYCRSIIKGRWERLPAGGR